jgi:hypothetical protein
MIQEIVNPDEDPGHLRGDAIASHLVLTGGSSHICSKGGGVWRTATRVDALGGNYSRADVPSGIYPKRGSGKRFRFLPYDAPQGLEHSIVIPSSLCQAGGITERSSYSRVDVGRCSGNQWNCDNSSTWRTSVTMHCGRALCTVRSPNKTGNRR